MAVKDAKEARAHRIWHRPSKVYLSYRGKSTWANFPIQVIRNISPWGDFDNEHEVHVFELVLTVRLGEKKNIIKDEE